ncbi:hypothetical protein [Amycolatopsis thermophila]|uniref:LPXTG-motif cell wall anchor domain-containing protein n=1 Tax=Amycolatopsis thermophila TaxID=206084 RepID=A0ABU0F5N4_9PSEU|nr:hypothetical protein [Amycolatopsis thermophila]MDQ0382644.1 hypothetical protein [Amycolatopsis thermophila]
MYTPKLAYTGAAGFTIAGIHFGLEWMVAIAVALIVLGIVLYRFGSRRRHRVDSK